MIRSFADKDTEQLFNRQRVRKFQSVEDTARRALLKLDAAASMDDLSAIPGNRIEKLPEFGKDVYSMRVNDKYRLIFRWNAGHAEDVRITDHYKL